MKKRSIKYKSHKKRATERRRNRAELERLERKYALIGIILFVALFALVVLLEPPAPLFFISLFLFMGYIIWASIMLSVKASKMFGTNYRYENVNSNSYLYTSSLPIKVNQDIGRILAIGEFFFGEEHAMNGVLVAGDFHTFN